MPLDPVEYERRFLAAVLETKDAKIWFSNAIPPYVRMMRKFGMTPRPPHYVPFKTAFIRASITFSIGWGVIMSYFVWDFDQMPIGIAIAASIISGTLFGLFLALYYRHGRNTHNLSHWDDL